MTPEEVSKELEEEIGVTPALAGTAAYLGLPKVLEPILGAPESLTDLVESGTPVRSARGTPIQEMAEFTRAEAESIRDFAKKQGVNVPILSAGPKAPASGFVYEKHPLLRAIEERTGVTIGDDLKPHVRLKSTSVPIALHELGHASPIAGSHKLRRAWQAAAFPMAQGGLVGDIARGALLGRVLMPPTDDSSDAQRFLYDHAPELVATTMLPELAEEARASYHALRGSRQAGVSTAAAIKELAPMLGTYVGAAAAPVLGTILAKKLVEYLHKKKRDEGQEKEAADAPKSSGLLRESASAAWRVGGAPPKPKSVRPEAGLSPSVNTTTKAKAPTNRSYYKDMLQSLYNPQRGFRLAVT